MVDKDRYDDFFQQVFSDSLRHLESYGGLLDAPDLNSPQRKIRLVEYPTKIFVVELNLEEFQGSPSYFEFGGSTQMIMEGRIVPIKRLNREYLRENGFGGRVFLDTKTQELTLEASQEHFVKAFQALSIQERLSQIGKAYCLGSVALALAALER